VQHSELPANVRRGGKLHRKTPKLEKQAVKKCNLKKIQTFDRSKSGLVEFSTDRADMP